MLLLVLVSLLSSLLVSDPLYRWQFEKKSSKTLTHIFLISLEPSHKFHIQRKTTNMGVTFYVKDNFRLAV